MELVQLKQRQVSKLAQVQVDNCDVKTGAAGWRRDISSAMKLSAPAYAPF